MPRQKKSRYRFFKFITWLLLLGYLLSISVAYVSSASWWFLDLFGLTFPVLLPVLIVFIIIWLLLNTKTALICLVVLLIGWKSIMATFGFHFHPKPFTNNAATNFTIVSYNVNDFKSLVDNFEQTRPHFLKVFKEPSPDILCLQEFSTIHLGENSPYNNLLFFQQQLGMPYFFSNDFTWTNPYKLVYYYGSVIYSKFPFIDTVRIERPDLNLGIIYADLKINNDTVRIITTHLQSFGLSGNDYASMHSLVKASDHDFRGTRNIWDKLSFGFRLREKQVDVLTSVVHQSPYPVILCGDFNTVPNSIAYFKLRDNLQDAFLQQGAGLGRTYYRLSPTLRIDYIMADKRFKINSFDVIRELLSDHYPVTANLQPK